MYMEQLQTFIELVCRSIDTFMIPRLMNNLKQVSSSNVIWINDAPNNNQYKMIGNALFLGLHNSNKYPYLLNYAATPENIELNFEITTVWGLFRDWLNREKTSLEHMRIEDKLSGNFIMEFNEKYEMIYLNNFDKTEMDALFNLPEHIRDSSDLSLDKIIRHQILLENIKQVIEQLIKEGIDEYEIPQPNLVLRLQLSGNLTFKGMTLIYKPGQSDYSKKNSNAFKDFEFVVMPILKILDRDSIPDNNQTIFSNRESIFSGLKPRRTTVDKRKSAYPRKPGQSSFQRQSHAPLRNSDRGASPDHSDSNKNPSRFSPGRSRGNHFDLDKQEDDDDKQLYKEINLKVSNSIVKEYMEDSEEEEDGNSLLLESKRTSSLGNRNQLDFSVFKRKATFDTDPSEELLNQKLGEKRKRSPQ